MWLNQPSFCTPTFKRKQLNFLKLGDLNFELVFGPSLGEISALTISNRISIDQALLLGYKRGKCMLNSHPAEAGKMLQLIGDSSKSIEVFEEFRGKCEDKEWINVSSVNSKKLVVVSGRADLIEEAKQYLRSQGVATRVLNVSNAFHSKLMEKGKVEFTEIINEFKFKEGNKRVLSTVSGVEVTKKSDVEIKDLLVRQLTEPIRLLECVELAKNFLLYDLVKRKEIPISEFI